MLIQHRITPTLWAEETGAEAEIKQQHDGPTGEGRQADQLNDLGPPGGPAVERHFEKAHPRGPHAHNRGDEIDRAKDRRNP